MWPVFLVYRAVTLGLTIVLNAVISSVAASNLSFASGKSAVEQVDAYLIFVGSSGLVVVFTIIFIEVFRRNALSSRVAFEVAWITLYWVFNFAGAAALSAVALGQMCGSGHSNNKRDHHSSGNGGCGSSRALVVVAWLNTVFLFVYFFLLTVFAIMHQKEDPGVWRSSVREFPWFATKQCIRSAPNSPMGARFAQVSAGLRLPRSLSGRSRQEAKPPSFAAPKPRRPPPAFVHQRAGLSSRVEIEHFSDVMSAESAPLASPPGMQDPIPVANNQHAAYAFYSQAVQNTIKETGGNAPATYVSNKFANTYSSSHPSSSPPPIRDWPRPIANVTDSPRSERSRQKQKAPPVPPSRSNSAVSRSSSGVSRRSAPPPPISLKRSETAPVSASQTSPLRSKPTGPRGRAFGNNFVRPRPPPLDLEREGARPVPSNRR